MNLKTRVTGLLKKLAEVSVTLLIALVVLNYQNLRAQSGPEAVFPPEVSPAAIEETLSNSDETHSAEDMAALLTGATSGGDPPVLVVPAAAFSKTYIDGADVQFAYDGYVKTKDHATHLIAPISLPHGARVGNIYASIVDDSGTYDVSVYLYSKYNYSTSRSQKMAELSSEELDPKDTMQYISVLAEDVEYPIISLPNYQYYLIAKMWSPLQRLYSVRIYYTLPETAYCRRLVISG